MKKFLTFSNIVAAFSFVVLMLFFTPCYQFIDRIDSTKPLISLFQATFGCYIPNPSSIGVIKVNACAGLIVGFVLLILGIVASVAKNKYRFAGFIASAFYIASGVLVACGVPMIVHCNYNISPMTYTLSYYGWSIAIAALLCFAGLCAFIEVAASYSKPKVQEVY